MTRGNAHQYLKKVYLTTKNDSYREALSVALSALRPVSREQVERVCGKWIIPTVIGGRAFNIPHCSVCNGVPCGTDENTKFCAHCGAPMTDEAVEMVMERMETIR